MARDWYHIDPSTGNWAIWPDTELPSGTSLFNVDFLNQFFAWRKYLGQIQYYKTSSQYTVTDPQLDETYTEHKLLSAGEIVQDRTLLNRLIFNPTGDSGLSGSRGVFSTFSKDSIVAGATIETTDLEEEIYSSTEWEDAEVLELEYGNNLQDILPLWLLNIRRRYDLCSVFYSDWYAHPFYGGTINTNARVFGLDPPVYNYNAGTITSVGWSSSLLIWANNGYAYPPDDPQWLTNVNYVHEVNLQHMLEVDTTQPYRIFILKREVQNDYSYRHPSLVTGDWEPISTGYQKVYELYDKTSDDLSFGPFGAVGESDIQSSGIYGNFLTSFAWRPCVIINDELADSQKPEGGFPWD